MKRFENLSCSCKLGLEGIVSKRKDSPYRSGRSPDWLRMKKPGLRCDEAGGGRGFGTVIKWGFA
jgi:hypothetical protein